MVVMAIWVNTQTHLKLQSHHAALVMGSCKLLLTSSWMCIKHFGEICILCGHELFYFWYGVQQDHLSRVSSVLFRISRV